MEEILLEINEKDAATELKKFSQETITIGRVAGNDIVLPRGNISKRHSRIVVKDGQLIIVDLKSTNGTYVNGKRISAPQVLNDNDKIYLGDFTISIKPSESNTSALSNADVLEASDDGFLDSDASEDVLDDIFDLSENDSENVEPDDLPSLDDALMESNVASSVPSSAPSEMVPEVVSEDVDDEYDLEKDPALEALFNDDSAAFDLDMDLEAPDKALGKAAGEARGAVEQDERTAFENSPPRSIDDPVPLGSFLDADVDDEIDDIDDDIQVTPKPEPQATGRKAEPARSEKHSPEPSGTSRRHSTGGFSQDAYGHVYQSLLNRLAEMDNAGYRDPSRIDTILDQVESGLDRLTFGDEWREAVRTELAGLGAFGDLIEDDDFQQVILQGKYLTARRRSGEIVDGGELTCVEATIDIISRLMPYSQHQANGVVQVSPEGMPGVLTLFTQSCDENRPSIVFERRVETQHDLVQLVKSKTLSKRMAQFLDVCIQKRVNILFSSSSPGLAGALMEALLHRTNSNEWLGIIDRLGDLSSLDSRAVRLQGADKTGEQIMSGLTALKPRHVVVHPIVEEGAAIVNWMRSGGAGFCGSIRCLSASDAVEALLQYIAAERDVGSIDVLRSQLVDHIDVVVQIGQLSDGRICVLEIVEPTDTDMEVVTNEAVFRFQQSGLDGAGAVQGDFVSAGYVPRFYDRLKRLGHQLDISLFKS